MHPRRKGPVKGDPGEPVEQSAPASAGVDKAVLVSKRVAGRPPKED
jgi:hypothetical protein